jgi:hypothetical protein
MERMTRMMSGEAKLVRWTVIVVRRVTATATAAPTRTPSRNENRTLIHFKISQASNPTIYNDFLFQVHYLRRNVGGQGKPIPTSTQINFFKTYAAS